MNRKPHKLTTRRLRLLNVRTAADLLGVSPWTVYHWARVGLVGSVTLGRRRLFELATLEDFVRRGRRHGRLVLGVGEPDKTPPGDPASTGCSEPSEAEVGPGS